MGTDKSTIIQNAQKYMAKGQIERAIEEWQKLIAETPNDGNIYNTIGDLYLKNNSPREAVETYLKAADAYNKAGFALKTIAVYKKAIKVDPGRMETYIKLADLHAERGLTGNAIEDYMRVARHYAKEGKVRESLEIYRKIANLDPTNVNIQIKLSELCLKEGLKQEALEGLVKAAQTCSNQGKSEEAKTLYSRILQIDPKNKVALDQVKAKGGWEAESRSETTLTPQPASTPVGWAQEEQRLQEAVKRSEASSTERHQLGTLLLKKGDLDGAFHQFQLAVQEYHHDQQWGPAIQLMQEYLKKDPKRIEAHELLGQSYEKSGLIDRAVEAYVNVIDLLIREEHSMTEAMELFNKINELDPQNPVLEKLKIRFGQQAEPHTKPTQDEEDSLQKSFPSSTTPFKVTSKEEASQSGQPVLQSSTVLSGSEGSGSVSGETSQRDEVQSYLTEAEVYLKYGLTTKALEQLQTAAKIIPDHPEIRQRLKELYRLDGKIPEVIQECLELARIYGQSKQEPKRRQVLEEALELDPENPKIKSLLGQGLEPSLSKQAVSSPSVSLRGQGGSVEAEIRRPEVSKKETTKSQGSLSQQSVREISRGPMDKVSAEVEELFAEGEFYFQQGLKEEARKLYEKVLALHPSHIQAQARLSEIGVELQSDVPGSELEQVKAGDVVEEAGPVAEVAEQFIEGVEAAVPGSPSTVQDEGQVNLSEMFMDALSEKSQVEPEADEEPVQRDPAQQELEALFREFKKGIKKQFDDQDYETHYNLGIAYKEMGLYTEAVEEFRLASKGQPLFIDAMGMIAVCHKEQGRFEEAIKQLQAALLDERCSGGHATGFKYELALLYESAGMKKEAMDLFDEIYAVDKTFKDVAQKRKDLKGDSSQMAKAGTPASSPKRESREGKPPSPGKNDKGKASKKKVSYL